MLLMTPVLTPPTRFFTLYCRAKYHISGRRPGFEYPYWKLPMRLPEEADEEAVMLIGGKGPNSQLRIYSASNIK